MHRSLVAAAALLGLAATPASAAQYMWDFSGTNLFGQPAMTQGNGVFTTSGPAMTVGGETAYAITGITGQVNGSSIAAPTGSYGNYFTTGPGFLDGTGVSFMTAAGTRVDFFLQDFVDLYRVNTFSPGATGYVTASSSLVASAPEPGTWAMVFVGLGMVGATLRYRPRQLALARV